ncbi:ELWxxDGT repeat protein [Azospirillum largimobile]
MAQAKIAVFTATLQNTGTEPWITDGTPSGTRLLADIRAGEQGSAPSDSVVAGSKLFFTADDGVHGCELWVTDGTGGGTRLFDAAAGAASSTPDDLTAVGDRLFFTADDGIHGRELWVSDGTTAGTRMVADLMPGTQGASPSALTGAHGRLYLHADGGAQDGIWSSDGTAAGTRLFHEMAPRPPWSQGITLIGMPDGRLAFHEGSASWPSKLTFVDAGGTATAFTELVPDGGGAVRYAATPDGLVASVTTVTEWTGSMEWPTAVRHSTFWATDGTQQGTRYLGDLTMQGWDLDSVAGLRNGQVMFTSDMDTYRVEQGAASRIGVLDAATGTVSYLAGQDLARPLGWLDQGSAGEDGDRLLFLDENYWSGAQRLLVTDGTPQGTSQLHQNDWMYGDIELTGDRAFFLTDQGGTSPAGLWVTDGTSEGTRQLWQTAGGAYGDTLLGEFADGVLGFDRDYSAKIDRFFLSDGTTDGTIVLAELPAGSGADYWDHTAKLMGVIAAPGGAEPDDIRKGTEGDDTLLGQDGADRIHGLGGNDRILAGAGDDRLNGGAGADHIDGAEGADRLYGMSGRDVLVPGAGRDIVDGGAGDDVLLAERDGESDQFFFAPGSGADVLTTVDPSLDVIILKGFEAAIGTAAWRAEHVVALGDGVRIDFGGGDSLLVLDTMVQDLRFTVHDPIF